MSTSEHRPRHGLTRRKWSAVATAAIVLSLIAGVIVQSREDGPVTDRMAAAAKAPEGTAKASAEEVAAAFLEAYGAFDLERARTYLADYATIASLGQQNDLGLLMSYLQATGYRQTVDSCRRANGSGAETAVRCSFAFHALRSDEMGKGPYGGSWFELIVRDGEIVHASQHWQIRRFSPQVWEPFAKWVSKAHPKDAAVMYRDSGHSNVRLTEESIRLWERRTRDYVTQLGNDGG
jgi:hypothetical protein